MIWYNDTKQIFESEVYGFFLNDSVKRIIFPGDADLQYPRNSNRIDNKKISSWHYTELHTHPETEIMIVLEGQCLLEHESFYYKLESGDIAVMNPNVPHRERAINYGEHYRNAYIIMEHNNVRLFATLYNTGKSFKYIHATPNMILRESTLIDIIHGEINYRQDNYKKVFYSFLKTFYLFLHRNLFTPHSDEINHDYDSELIYKITDYIQSNLSSEISTEEISTYFNISKSSLCNLFKRNMNVTLSEYINYYRVKRALHLLQQSNKKVCDIANEVGYRDQYYFCKVFRSHVGKSPSKFRNN